MTDKPACDGRCLYPADLGLPEFDRGEPAYPDPECSLHGAHDEVPLTPEEEEVCPSDMGERPLMERIIRALKE